MAWCEECDQQVAEDALSEEGECPTCGGPVATHRKIPWQFKIMIYITIVYLGYRAYQGITWLVHHV